MSFSRKERNSEPPLLPVKERAARNLCPMGLFTSCGAKDIGRCSWRALAQGGASGMHSLCTRAEQAPHR